MDLLGPRPKARATALQRCDEAVVKDPFNPHVRYLQGVLLAQDGRFDDGIAALRVSVDRYFSQQDRTSELEARLALQQLSPRDEENRRRIAELHFEKGEVRQAMQALAGLARSRRPRSRRIRQRIVRFTGGLSHPVPRNPFRYAGVTPHLPVRPDLAARACPMPPVRP